MPSLVGKSRRSHGGVQAGSSRLSALCGGLGIAQGCSTGGVGRMETCGCTPPLGPPAAVSRLCRAPCAARTDGMPGAAGGEGPKLRLTSQLGRCLWERLSSSLERKRTSWELRQHGRPRLRPVALRSTASGRFVSGTLQDPALRTAGKGQQPVRE